MIEMLESLISGFKIISLLFGLFGLFFFANTMFGLYINTHHKQEKFELVRLWQGIKRCLVLFLGIVSLIIGVSTVGSIINLVQIISVEPEIVDGISIAAMAGIIIASTVDYAKQSISKFSEIIKYKIKTEEENQDEKIDLKEGDS